MSKGGRPSRYRAEYSEQAFRLCLLGATDADLAGFFAVSEQTINAWKQAHPKFLESLKAGKDEADANVAKSLYRRALGYSHDAVKIVADAKTGTEHTVPYVEHYPPDTTACIFWLKNRQRTKWRDKQDVEHSGEVEVGVRTVRLPPVTPDPNAWAAQFRGAVQPNGNGTNGNGNGKHP